MDKGISYVDNPFKSPAIISFCPGILGLERGLARVGVECRVMAYMEIEAFIIANLVAGMEAGLVGAAPIWTDAKTFDARPFRGRIHGIIGGYPCPGESLAGLREGHLYKGFIWPSIRRAIAAAGPLWCFFENVDDHLTGTYPIVQRSLYNMGYSVEAGVFSAEEIGAPHERKRLFILAIRKELANAYCDGTGTRPGKIIDPCRENEEKTQWQKWHDSIGKWVRNDFGDIGKVMADSQRQGLAQRQEQYAQSQQPPIERSGHKYRDQWPAGQGKLQHGWEYPRTIKSGLGCTIDGYNFREDLLRAIGNSVVEQTAELAFITLLIEHINNKT